jgi:3-hydroxyisobutyrate dehydrogenase-like beta-hydroxyacid dehydrogenase
MSVTVAGHAIHTLGFVGLGVMGEPMCANLVEKAGLPVFGTDRRPEPVEALVQRGMKPAADVAELARHADLVFICVANGEQLRAICSAGDGLFATDSRVRVIVDSSTTSVALTRELAAQCSERGVLWVDAPVARMREAARTGTLSIMVGAGPDVFEALSPLLRCMGSDLTHCGPVGSAQVVKILNNKVLFETVHALAEALAIARGAGVDGAVLFDALAKGSADSKALRFQGIRHLLAGDFPPATFPTRYARKDIGLALELADELGIDARCARTTSTVFDEAIESGYGDDYYPVILKLLTPPRAV